MLGDRIVQPVFSHEGIVMICMTGRFIIFALAITAFAVPAHAQFSPPGATWNGGGTESGRRSVSQSEAREAVEQAAARLEAMRAARKDVARARH